MERRLAPPAPGSTGALLMGIRRLSHAIRQAFGRELATHQWVVDAGFRPPCFGVLHAVHDLQPVSQREVSDVLGIDAGDLVAVVDILERAGFLTRERDPADRRRYALAVTPAGVEALGRLHEIAGRVVEEVLGALSAEERVTLSQLADKALSGLAD